MAKNPVRSPAVNECIMCNCTNSSKVIESAGGEVIQFCSRRSGPDISFFAPDFFN